MTDGKLAQRKAGVESLAEHSPEQTEPRDALTIDQFNDRYVRRMARQAAERKRGFAGGISEAEALRAIENARDDYVMDFIAFWSRQKMDVDRAAAEAAWRKVRQRAIDEYAKLQAAPKPPEQKPVEQTPSVPQPEVPAPKPMQERVRPEFIEDVGWLRWDKETFSQEKFHQFTAAFLPELAKAVRAGNMDELSVKNFYQLRLFNMYLNQYPDIPKDQIEATRMNVQSWLDARWDEALARARELPVS